MICFGLLNFVKYGFPPGHTAGQLFGSRVTIQVQSNYLFMPFRIFCCKSFYFLDMSLCERKWTFAAFANISFFKEILCFLNGHQDLKSECVIYTYILTKGLQRGRLRGSLGSHGTIIWVGRPMFRMPFHEAKGGDWGETHRGPSARVNLQQTHWSNEQKTLVLWW